MNYQMVLDETLQKLKESGKKPKLLLQVCCAPCSSYVLSYLHEYFQITCFYYNPNITWKEEFERRMEEVKRFTQEAYPNHEIQVMEGPYEPEKFFQIAKGKETMKEGSERCYDCYYLRLDETASFAKEHGYDYFGTTLSISPYKNSKWLNEIGEELAQKYGVAYLYADFKKKGGYLKSIALSKQYHLYRQDYCGCPYSKLEHEERVKLRASKND